MKTLIPFLLFELFVLSGCNNKPIRDVNEVSYMQNIDSQIREINSEITEVVNLYQKLPTSYTITDYSHPTMLTDVLNVKAVIANLKATKANLEITKANLEASQKLIQSIEQFNKSSTKLSNRMLWLTRFIAVLTFILMILAFEQLTDKWLYRKILSYKSASSNVALEEEAITEPPKNIKTNSTSQTNITEKEADTEIQDTNSVSPSG